MPINDFFTKKQKKNIVVTGGAGFIGSHLCDRLIQDGHNVICIDNFVSGSRENIEFLLQMDNFKFINQDVVETIELESLPELKNFNIASVGIQEIYNLACPTSYKEYEELPLQTILANSHGTRNILELAVKYKSKVLHTSTSSVYGEPLAKMKYFREDYWGYVNPIGPRSCYNEGKRFAESLIYTYGEHYNIDVKIARIFQTYGPRMKFNDARMIPDIIKSALKNEDLIIFGNENKSTSFLYISDLIDGLLKFMNSDINGVINFGHPKEILISDAAKIVIELVGSNSQIKYKSAPPFIIEHGLPDTTKAKEDLGWFPLVSLQAGLTKTVEYMKAQKNVLNL